MSSLGGACAATRAISGCSLKTTPATPKPVLPPQNQKTTFLGLSISDGKRGFRIAETKRVGRKRSVRGVEIEARTAGASKSIEVEVDKPLGLTLGQKPGGGVVIAGVDSGGNAAKAGLKVGDQVLYTSSFFGDELWPADKLGFTKTAIQAKPDSVYFVVSSYSEVALCRLFSGDGHDHSPKKGYGWTGLTEAALTVQPAAYKICGRGAEVDVKRLVKRPAPPRFGRTLTETQKARATHICLDCGFIYTLQKPFEEQPDSYLCPQCRAPKKRFAQYDVNTGKPIGGGLPPIGVIVGLVAGIAAVGALLVYGLQ